LQIIRDTIRIKSQPARVWNVLAHAEEFDLQAGDTREEITSAKKQGEGMTMRVVRRLGPLTLVLNGRVNEWEEERIMSSEWSSGWPLAMATRVRMKLAAGENGTVLEREYTVQVRTPLVGGIVERFFARNAPRDMQALLDRIRIAAEQ
jgi:carbon monoxide dehydrogenase subunit G